MIQEMMTMNFLIEQKKTKAESREAKKLTKTDLLKKKKKKLI